MKTIIGMVIGATIGLGGFCVGVAGYHRIMRVAQNLKPDIKASEVLEMISKD